MFAGMVNAAEISAKCSACRLRWRRCRRPAAFAEADEDACESSRAIGVFVARIAGPAGEIDHDRHRFIGADQVEQSQVFQSVRVNGLGDHPRKTKGRTVFERMPWSAPSAR